MAEKPVTQEITKPSFISPTIPEYLRGTGGVGFEGFDASDMETPRITLLQPTSPQVTDFETARPGMFWHNVMDEPVGDVKTGFLGVICFINKRAILWRPRPPHDTGGILARTDDLRVWNPPNAEFDVTTKTGRSVKWKTRSNVDQSRLLEWGTYDPSDSKSPPAATLMHEYVLTFPEHPHLPPAVLTFQVSSLHVSKRLLRRMRYSTAVYYSFVFRFGSDLVDNSGFKFYIPTFEQVGYLSDPEMVTQCERLHDVLKKSGLKVRDEDAPDEPIPEGNGPAY